MKLPRLLALIVILLQFSKSQAEVIAPGKTGSELVTLLRLQYRPSSTLSYKDARKQLFSSIDNRGSKVRCVYTGKEITTSGIPDVEDMNTEHTWPQSKFHEKLPMRSDLHHLFPTLTRVNSERGNLPFADIADDHTQGWWRSETKRTEIPGGSEIAEYSESTPQAFEPREDHKGNVARAMIYFATVYSEDEISAGWIIPQLPTLVHWHQGDPVDEPEKSRNAAIKAVQGNDNPFVLDSTLVYRALNLPVSEVSPVMAAPAFAPAATGPITVRVVGWNVQSNFDAGQEESDPVLIKEQMAAKDGVDIWGLSEVLDATALQQFEEGAEQGEGSDFISVMGMTGGRDRLAVIFDSALFEQVGSPMELTAETQLSGGLRASLVVHLRGKRTGKEFLVMVNHLKRGGAQNRVRLKQSKNLNAWARTQTLPIIAMGDWNYDYDIEDGDNGPPNRDGGFDALTKDNVFQWVRPAQIVKSQADDNFNTLLDFIFVANAPFEWTGMARILERESDIAATTIDFDDDERNSDHRPVDAVFILDRQ